MADAHLQDAELRLGLCLRLRRHPGEAIDARAERSQEISHHLLGARLLRGREVTRDVQLAHRLAERGVGRGDRPLPALAQTGGAQQHLSVEGELLVDERLGQEARDVLESMEGQVVLPGIERLLADERRDAGDRGRLPDHEPCLTLEAGGSEESLPVEAGRAAVEVLARPVIVSLRHVGGVHAAQVRFGDPPLELEDPRGLRLGGGDPGELQHALDVGLVLAPDLRHPPRRVEVVGAIGHPEATLQEERRVAVRVVQVLRHPEAEQVVGMELGVVEDVDVRAQVAAQGSRQALCILDGGDAVERGLEGREPSRLDPRLVHEARVVVPDLPRVGAAWLRPVRQLRDQIGNPPVGQLRQLGAGAPAAAVGRNLGAPDPGSVGVGEEVVARRDRSIHAGDVEAQGGGSRRRGVWRRDPGGRGAGAEEDEGEAGNPGQSAGGHELLLPRPPWRAWTVPRCSRPRAKHATGQRGRSRVDEARADADSPRPCG